MDLDMLNNDDCKQLTASLLEFLQQYPSTKHKTSVLIFDNGAFRPRDIDSLAM